MRPSPINGAVNLPQVSLLKLALHSQWVVHHPKGKEGECFVRFVVIRSIVQENFVLNAENPWMTCLMKVKLNEVFFGSCPKEIKFITHEVKLQITHSSIIIKHFEKYHG